MKDKRYDIELEVVTPLSTGAGNENDWVMGADCVNKDGYLYVIDYNKLPDVGIELNVFSSILMKNNQEEMCELLGNKLEQVSKNIFKLPAKCNNPIKTFQRTQLYGLPLIPGSSIKGAIRSVLFNYFRTNEIDNKSVFGSMKDGTDFMRFIQIGDIEMPETLLVNTKIYNLWKNENGDWNGGWKQNRNFTSDKFNPSGFNTIYECVQPNNKGLGVISISSSTFEKVMQRNRLFCVEKKKRITEEGLDLLFYIINKSTRDYLQKEKDFFIKYTTDRTDEIVTSIDNMLNLIPNDNSYCLLKMSAGVGFHSITGDWQYKDYDTTGFWESGRNKDKKKYKSRKIAEYEGKLHLMGFVKISKLSPQESLVKKEKRCQEHQTYLNHILQEYKEKEHQIALIEKEKLEQIKRKEEERLKKEKYEQLYDKIQSFIIENKLQEALNLAIEANNICPNNRELDLTTKRIKKLIEIDEYTRNEEEARKIRLSQPLSEVLKGKTSSIGNILGHTKKWLQNNNSISDAEIQTLTEALESLPRKEIKKIKSKQKELTSIVGEDNAKKLLKRLCPN